MKTKFFFLAVVGSIFMVQSAYAITGNEYGKLTKDQQLAWIIGVADGLSTAELIATRKQPPISECLGKLDWEQIQAIFGKALENDPEHWHFPAAFVFHRTFYKYCGIN